MQMYKYVYVSMMKLMKLCEAIDLCLEKRTHYETKQQKRTPCMHDNKQWCKVKDIIFFEVEFCVFYFILLLHKHPF